VDGRDKPGHDGILLQPFDDAQVAHRAVAERLERFLVGGTIVRGLGLRDALPLDDDRAFLLPGLVGQRRNAAGEKLRAAGGKRRSRELGVSRDFVGIADLAIDADPVGFGHEGSGDGGVGVVFDGWSSGRAGSVAAAHAPVIPAKAGIQQLLRACRAG
jgi:hypothetical protein